ncbi:MAG TPA: PadR family transcriptional regulator [Solirubrobacterales bacterium]
MSSEIRLTPTSFIVLGLVEAAGEATPYDLKNMVGASLGNFWSLQHAQLYSEPQRLATAGYLAERRETSGRRRRHYRLAAEGKRALREWLAEPTAELTEMRDLALLKIFFGANPVEMAAEQVEAHRNKLAEYEDIMKQAGADLPPGVRLSLEAGILAERTWLDFWSRHAE